MRLVALVLVLAVVATTCAVPSRTTRHDTSEPIESASHDPDREGALVGAAAGAALGALIGYASCGGCGNLASYGAILWAVPGLLLGTVVGAAIDASDAFEPARDREPVLVRPDTTAAAPDSIP